MITSRLQPIKNMPFVSKTRHLPAGRRNKSAYHSKPPSLPLPRVDYSFPTQCTRIPSLSTHKPPLNSLTAATIIHTSPPPLTQPPIPDPRPNTPSSHHPHSISSHLTQQLSSTPLPSPPLLPNPPPPSLLPTSPIPHLTTSHLRPTLRFASQTLFSRRRRVPGNSKGKEGRWFNEG